MISDTLHDAVSEIDQYLREDADSAARMSNPDYGYMEEAIRAHILDVRDRMEALRCVLDTMPDGSQPPPRPNPFEVKL